MLRINIGVEIILIRRERERKAAITSNRVTLLGFRNMLS